MNVLITISNAVPGQQYLSEALDDFVPIKELSDIRENLKLINYYIDKTKNVERLISEREVRSLTPSQLEEAKALALEYMKKGLNK